METKYLRMIQGMKRKGQKDWTVYILRCGDGSLYTGITKDVQARVKQHSEGRGATYTRTRLPVKLLYQQGGLTRSKALIREAQIKAMPRSKKEEIIFRGSHRQYKHPTIPGRVTIAGHPNDDLAPGTLNSILKQAKLKEVK